MKAQRSTYQRQLVADAVRSHRDHPSADQIYQEVRKKEHRISRGTVYRNLKRLAESGEIRQVKMTGADRFDWHVAPHYHLLCVGCGVLMDVPLPYRADFDQAIERETGYQISYHRMTFEGLCPECRRTPKPLPRETQRCPAK